MNKLDLNSIDLKQFLINEGYTLLKQGANEYKVREIKGGCFVNSDKNIWHSFSDNTGGGIIQFLDHYNGMDFKKAINYLMQEKYIDEEKRLKKDKVFVKRELTEEKQVDFKLPEKDTTMKNTFAYLIKTRGIDDRVVKYFVKEGLIYQSIRHNAVFIGKDKDGIVKYAMQKGTNAYRKFAGEVRGSKKEFSFHKAGKTDKLYVFEAPIDLMSYQTLLIRHGYKDRLEAHYLSLGGVSDKALERYLEDNTEIKKVVLCLDNDKVGNENSLKIYNKYRDKFEITRHQPRLKDFNEILLDELGKNKEKVTEKENKIDNINEMHEEVLELIR